MVHRRQALQLSIRHRNWLGDQEWQAHANAEEPFVQRIHDGILEFDGRDLLSRRVDSVGHAKLWKGPTPTSDGDWSWSGACALSWSEGGKCIQRDVMAVDASMLSHK